MANYFEAEISLSFRAFGWHGKKLVVFRHEEYYDFWALVDGIHYGLEAKSTAKLESFPFDRLQEHQLKGLLDCETAGGLGYVLLSFRKTSKGKPAVVAYAVRARNWLRLKTEIYKDRKSIPVSAYAEHPDIFIPLQSITLAETKKRIWDLRALLPVDSPAARGGYTCPSKLSKRKSQGSSRPATTTSSSSRKPRKSRRAASS